MGVNALALSILVAATAPIAVQAQSPGKPVKIGFGSTATGAQPSGFIVALTGQGVPPRWVVIEDATAPSGSNRVAAETSGDTTDNRFPLLIYDGLDAKDVQVTVRFKPVSGKVDQAAGLAVRLRDANNYYIVRANALEDNVRLYKVVAGKRHQFAGRDVKVPAGRWHTLGIKIESNRIDVFFNGRELFSATDKTLADSGKVGLWTKADSLTYFDDLTIKLIPQGD
jgi:hypothetical protein